MASCIKIIHTKSYQNLIFVFQVTVKNVGDAFLRHCSVLIRVNDVGDTLFVDFVLSARTPSTLSTKNLASLSAVTSGDA